jgi:hypothetical protein
MPPHRVAADNVMFTKSRICPRTPFLCPAGTIPNPHTSQVIEARRRRLYLTLIGIVPASSPKNPMPTEDTKMSNVTQTIDNCLAAWNERDTRRRRELIAKTWTENGSYVDPHRGGTRYDQLNAMIQTVHDAFTPEYRFRLASRVDEYGDRVRFQWEAGGTKDAPLHFVGTDFAIVGADGRFVAVTGFVDESPQPRRRPAPPTSRFRIQ